jgi:hypothetical protein
MMVSRLAWWLQVINDVYRQANPGQSAIFFLNFALETDSYDVNVTPDKRTIMLHDESDIVQALKVLIISHRLQPLSLSLSHTHTLTHTTQAALEKFYGISESHAYGLNDSLSLQFVDDDEDHAGGRGDDAGDRPPALSQGKGPTRAASKSVPPPSPSRIAVAGGGVRVNSQRTSSRQSSPVPVGGLMSPAGRGGQPPAPVPLHSTSEPAPEELDDVVDDINATQEDGGDEDVEAAEVSGGSDTSAKPALSLSAFAFSSPIKAAPKYAVAPFCSFFVSLIGSPF